MASSKCPNCGGSYNPTSYVCDYCGSYVITAKENYVDLSKINIELKKKSDKYPGIYVYGRLLGRGEKPISLGAANYYTGAVAAGGKLLLTNHSLSFSAHGFNVGRTETTIKLSEITKVELAANFLISQHILVSTPTGKHKFVVYHGKEWIEKIVNAKNNPLVENEDTQVHELGVEITIKCEGCGGVNTIRKGEVSECEFCGSTIKGE